MRKITTFTLNGQPLVVKRSGSVTDAVKKMLDKLPEGSLLTRKEVSDRVGCAQGSMPTAADVPGYAMAVNSKTLWGSKRTISQLEDELGNHD